jgi:hypothetical protein
MLESQHNQARFPRVVSARVSPAARAKHPDLRGTKVLVGVRLFLVTTLRPVLNSPGAATALALSLRQSLGQALRAWRTVARG